MYLRISVEVSDVEPNVTISPAACHVVPEVELVALEQHDVGPARVGEVVGDRAADDAAADDDDAGASGAGPDQASAGQVRGQPAGSRPMAS